MSAATVWSAGAVLSLGTIVAPTSADNGLFFQVTQAGTTGNNEPNWVTTIGEIVYDNEVRYISISSVASDLQRITPSSIIELFTLQTSLKLHGSNQIYRFHNGTNLNNNGDIIWAGDQYLKMPIKAEGFAFRRGQLPRPTFTVSNALSTITAILLDINKVTAVNDLGGATVTRIRTLARYIDAVNFPPNENGVQVNPFGTPDPTAEFPKEIYTVDRKSVENRDIVQFELAAVFDIAGVRAPQRQCTRTLFPAIGSFII